MFKLKSYMILILMFSVEHGGLWSKIQVVHHKRSEKKVYFDIRQHFCPRDTLFWVMSEVPRVEGDGDKAG